MAEFDDLAEHYDLTRGGEQRGDEYALDIDAQLPSGDGPILEIGVGTGVVALGLARRGRRVVGLDISAPMLTPARKRLGPAVLRSDAMRMAIATNSVAHAVSVWVLQSVADPLLLFEEAARVIRPGGLYIMCTSQHPVDDVGRIVEEMGARVDVLRGAARPRGISVEQALEWASAVGFTGTVRQFERTWYGTPADELFAIMHRTWPAMRELDEDEIEEATRPAIEALEALPATDQIRRAIANMIVFEYR